VNRAANSFGAFFIQIDATASKAALVKDWRVVKRVIFSQKYIPPKFLLLLAGPGLAFAEREMSLPLKRLPINFST
jgi:hypothetical protein